MELLFHLTTPALWAEAREAGQYRWSTRGKPFDEVGFVHASSAHQVEGVANAVYAGEATLTLLVVDPVRLEAEVRVENLEGGRELFPHIYGPLPLNAVIATEELHANAAGLFRFPAVP